MSTVQGLHLPLERFEKGPGTGVVPTIPFPASCSGVPKDRIYTNYHENFWHNIVPPGQNGTSRAGRLLKAVLRAGIAVWQASISALKAWTLPHLKDRKTSMEYKREGETDGEKGHGTAKLPGRV
jgi:hypothetical protein